MTRPVTPGIKAIQTVIELQMPCQTHAELNMATATLAKKKVDPSKARSPLVAAILTTLNRKSWVTRKELTDKVGHLIPKVVALKVYEFRIGQDDKPMVKLARGRECQVMLTAITLVQHGKLVQRNKGEAKEYKLA